MRYSKKTMKLRIDYNNMMQSVIGKEGYTDEDINALEQELNKAFDSVEQGKGKGMMGWADLPYNPRRNRRRYYRDGKGYTQEL